MYFGYHVFKYLGVFLGYHCVVLYWLGIGAGDQVGGGDIGAGDRVVARILVQVARILERGTRYGGILEQGTR